MQCNIFCSNQFGFQQNHFSEYAIIQLVDQLLTSFEENKFILGLFVDFKKSFQKL